MIELKRFLLVILVSFTCLLSFDVFSEAPVVDDSENFMILEEEQAVVEQPALRDQADIYNNAEEIALANDSSLTSQNDNAILLDKIQGLQQELQELRGQLEVQTHDLKLLQQQQFAFYKDLDERLHSQPTQAVKNNEVKEPSFDTPKSAKTESTRPENKPEFLISHPTARTNPADEQISYLAAYELIKNKRFDEALPAMQAFISHYPRSGYAANAQYWLGELHMVKKNHPKAIEHFETVLRQFPSSSKSSASLLKIGYALAASGKKVEAKQRLQQVLKNYPGTHTAKLAAAKLESLNI